MLIIFCLLFVWFLVTAVTTNYMFFVKRIHPLLRCDIERPHVLVPHLLPSVFLPSLRTAFLLHFAKTSPTDAPREELLGSTLACLFINHAGNTPGLGLITLSGLIPSLNLSVS